MQEIDRTNYPRVSTITFPWSRSEYDGQPLEKVAKAAERGTEVHAFCTALVRGDFLPSPSAEVDAYVNGFKHWWSSLKNPQLILSEERLFDDTLKFSGQADIIYRVGDQTYLVDIKTSSRPSPVWPIQLCAYAYLAKLHNYHIDGAMILHLRTSSKWLNEQKLEKVYKTRDPNLIMYTKKQLDDYWKRYFFPALEWYYLFNEEKKC